MSIVSKYIKAIQYLYKFENFSSIDNDTKEKLKADIVTLTVDRIGGQYFTKYLSNLNLSDIEPLSDIISEIVGNKMEKDGASDIRGFENIIAILACYGIWSAILQRYTDLKLIWKDLENKDVSLDFKIKSLDSHLNIFNKLIFLQENGFKIIVDSNETNYIEEYTKLLKFYNILKEPIKTKEELQIEEIVSELWGEVLPIYTELYKNSIESGYVGVLTKDGLLYWKNGKIEEKKDAWSINLVNSFFQSNIFNFKITHELEKLEKKELLDSNYLAKFHTLNASGVDFNNNKVKRWDDFVPILEKRFKPIAYSLFSCYSLSSITEHYNDIKAILTNCVIVEQYDRTVSLFITYRLNNVINEYNTYFKENYKNITGRESCKILKEIQSQNRVNTLFGVFDAKKFALEPLFSYQAYDKFVENGGKVSLNKVIIGRSLDGSDVLFPLSSNDARVVGIFAGSGSGKGVMTLGLLSAIIANKSPFIYLDYKPDMAALLWDIELEFRSKGIKRSDGKDPKILAIDAKKDMDSCNPVRKHRFAESLPSYLSTIPSGVFSVLPYVKLLQLYYLLGGIRTQVENKPDFGGAMTFAILDEFQMNIKDNLSKLVTTLDGVSKSAKKNNDKSSVEIGKYINKLKEVIKRLGLETSTFINTDGRVSQCRAIYLGQSSSYEVWSSDPVEEVKTLAKGWYSNTSYRFFGRNGGSGSYYPTVKGVIEEFVVNPETFGYWTYAAGAGKVNDITNWNVFKAYSVLNKNDFNIDNPANNGPYTSGVLNNIPDDEVKRYVVNEIFTMKDENNNMMVRPEVGFLDLVRKISGFTDVELADAFSEGYYVIWKVMQKYGLDKLYPDIETYLFDASLESLYTLDEIKKGVFSNESGLSEYDPNDPVFTEKTEPIFDYNDPSLSDEEKERIFIEKREEKQKLEEEENLQELLKEIEIEIIKLKTQYGTKISTAGKSLYTYKKDEILFNDAKQNILNSRIVYEQGFNAIIERIPKEEYRETFYNNVQEFLDQRFSNIENITFESIVQGERNKSVDSEFTPKLENQNLTSEIENQSSMQRLENQGSTQRSEKQSSMQKSENESSMQRSENQSLIQKPKGKNTLNNQRLTSQINTGNLTYNPRNIDSMGNVKASKQLTDQIIKDITIQFGGANNIDSIAVTASGCLVLNDYAYCPQFPETFMNSLGLAIRNDLENGKLYRVVNLGYIVFTFMNQCVELTIESPKIASSTLFKNELRVKKSYGELFKRNPNLQIIRLPNEELTRNNPEEQDNSGGLGSKLAGLFGLGRQNNKSDNYVPNPTASSRDNDLVDRMFESKPVRILTSALGWTLGCKAVVLAATFLGPWGLLFGAFAAAGAYNEMKNDRYSSSRNSNGYSSNRGTGSRNSGTRNNGSRNSTGSKGNGNSRNKKSQQYDDDFFD